MNRSENPSESEIEEVEPFVLLESTEDRNTVMETTEDRNSVMESTEDRNSVMESTEDRNSVMESTEDRNSVMNLSCGIGETFKRMIGNLFKNRENNRSKSESSEMAAINSAEATGDRNCATDLFCGIGDAFQKILQVMNIKKTSGGVTRTAERFEEELERYGSVPDLFHSDETVVIHGVGNRSGSDDSRSELDSNDDRNFQGIRDRYLAYANAAFADSSSEGSLPPVDPMDNSIESSIYTNIEGLEERLRSKLTDGDRQN